ncbi:MAG: hypothetical protein JWP11_3677 [Frankiales bacterium]|nr:hypothetical protein [Frankiales bacterium]
MPGCAGGHKPGRCKGHRSDSSGKACQQYRVRGAAVCVRHGASAPQVRQAARLRLLEAADLMAGQMVKLATDTTVPPAVRQRAMADVLDRAGLSARQYVEVSSGEASAQVEQAVDELWRLLQADPGALTDSDGPADSADIPDEPPA